MNTLIIKVELDLGYNRIPNYNERFKDRSNKPKITHIDQCIRATKREKYSHIYMSDIYLTSGMPLVRKKRKFRKSCQEKVV